MTIEKLPTKEDVIEELKHNLISRLNIGEDGHAGVDIMLERTAIKMQAVCTAEITSALNSLQHSMNLNAKSADSLAGKVFALNVILVVLGGIGTIVSILALMK